MLQALRLVLQACGQCAYLSSLYTLWKDLAQGLWTMERQLWPEQAPETELALILPHDKHALGELLLPGFAGNVQYVKNGLQSLDVLTTWFTGCYDIQLHSAFHAVLEDTLMIFRSIDTMFRMKARIIAAGQVAPSEAAPPPVAVTGAPAPATASSNPAPAEPLEMMNQHGDNVTWY